MTVNSATGEQWTIGRLLEWTTGYFQQNSVDNPRLDVEVLLAHVLECQRIDLYANYDSPVDELHRAKFRQLVRKRVQGCPVAYLVGYKEFYTLRFMVNRSVLIPRPETEHVVIEALDHLRELPSPRFLEIGVGSGAIAVTLLHECPKVTGLAVDISPDAIQVAQTNAETNGVLDRLEFRISDVYQAVAPEPFDLIVSNPPYVTNSEYELLEKTARDYEPATAFLGGPEGLDVIARVVEGAADRLRPEGKLILEIGCNQEQSVRQLIASNGMFQLLPTVLDLARRPRVVVAVRNAR